MIFLLGLMSAVVASMMDISPDMRPHLKRASNDPKVYSVALSSTGDVSLQWRLDYYKKMVSFRITFDEKAPDFDWFAFGFSDYGNLKYADYCIMRHIDDIAVMQDYVADGEGHVKLDKQQNCIDFDWDNDEKIIVFSRYFDTCDYEDYIIEEGTTHLLWAMGTGASDPQPVNLVEDGTQRGMVRVQLLKNEHAAIPLPEDVKTYDFTVENFQVPDSDTTYYCTTRRMPDWMLERRHQIVKYESLITKGNEGLVHHIEIFYCDAPKNHKVEKYDGPCPDKPDSALVCSKVRAAWAMGATPFYYPKEAGLSIGGPSSNPTFMMEIHYNNPGMKKDWVDSSGIRIYLTSQVRKYEASIMELGLEYTDKMMIPPRQPSFKLSGFCTSACTKTGLPEGGIIVFGSQLHTHTTGIFVETRHFRNGHELPTLNQDKHYSTHFQEIRVLKRFVHVKPGDFLITSCNYNTTDRARITFGGHSIQDEMCVNYIHYYPATNLEVCKSSVSTETLKNFFKFQKEMNDAPINQKMTVREKFNAIDPWSQMNIDTLKYLFHNETIAMQCNTSSGTRFKGLWDPSSMDVILTKLPTPARECANKK